MSVDVTEYRFKSLGAHGHIILNENDVTCDTTSYLGRWKATTPYTAVEPYPITTWQTPPITFYCGAGLAFLTVFFAFVAVGELRSNAWMPSVAFVVYALLCAVCLGLSVRVVREWKTEWIMFPTAIDGHRISYIKTHQDPRLFEEFTATLTNRIVAANSSQRASKTGLSGNEQTDGPCAT